MAKIFFSYSHKDEELRDQLETQLALLKRQGFIETWHDRRIFAGQDFANEIDAHLEEADIILLLVSPDFLASDYCYEKEMTRAIERHKAGTAKIIPVILRPCPWHSAPFGRLNATPKDGRPVTRFSDRDEALLEVALAIKGAAEASIVREIPRALSADVQKMEVPTYSPRSSNLRVAKEFTQRDKDRFQHQVFEFMAKFFENSLAELQVRNEGIEGDFRRVDANRFIASVYKQGHAVSRCTIFMGSGHFGGGIAYTMGETLDSNSINENLTVEADDQKLYLRPLGFAHQGGERDPKFTEEGASEFYWSMLIGQLQ